MLTVNDIGGTALSATIFQTESNEISITLKSPLIRDTQNWSVGIQDFTLSTLPNMNDAGDEDFLTILPFEGINLALLYNGANTFRPVGCTSIAELFRQLLTFQDEFNRMCYNYGLGASTFYAADAIKANFIGPGDRNTTIRNELDDEKEDPARDFIKFELTAGLRLRVFLSDAFRQNFYIQLSENVAENIGLQSQLFHVTGGGNTVSSSPGTPVIYDGANFQHVGILNARGVVTAPPVLFESTESIAALDERSSIDVISTIPVARKAQSVNGKHSEESLLARFDLHRFKNLGVETTYTQPLSDPLVRLTNKVYFQNVSLTNGDLAYEANTLLGGAIQTILMKVYVAYVNQDGTRVRKPLDVKDGYWSITMLFAKNI
jgi:hypothetical protein